MKRSILAAVVGLTITLTAVSSAAAAPGNSDNYPTNPNACVGNSSTTANAMYQASDPDKLRSDQAREDGQPGRADRVAIIPQCLDSGNDRGVIK